VNTLVSTVKKYELDRYDDFTVYSHSDIVISDNTEILPNLRPIIRKGDTGSYVRILQEYLNSTKVKKYNCGDVDGIFGKKTDKAVRAFQKDNKLVVDGAVGPKTWALIG
jgi:peptidoglycan hydrolase-like protein with peptidoglycan-binding domain